MGKFIVANEVNKNCQINLLGSKKAFWGQLHPVPLPTTCLGPVTQPIPIMALCMVVCQITTCVCRTSCDLVFQII